MDDIVWAKGGVSPGTNAIELEDETHLNSTVILHYDSFDWIALPDNENLGNWAGKQVRVLDTHKYPCPLDPTQIVKWHRLDGPFWCVESVYCSQWLIIEKGEAQEWLNNPQ